MAENINNEINYLKEIKFVLVGIMKKKITISLS